LKVLELATIKPGGMADLAGLKPLDQILSYDGVTPDYPSKFTEAVFSDNDGDIEIDYIRDGQHFTCTGKRGVLGITSKVIELDEDIYYIPVALRTSSSIAEDDSPSQVERFNEVEPKNDIFDGASGVVIIWGGLIGYVCLLGYLEGIKDGLGGKVFIYTILAGFITWLASFIFKNGKDGAGEQTFKVIAFVVFIIIAIAISGMFSGGGGGGAYRVGDW